ncbi:hypothetical protein [Paracoccus mutanolyticus]|uniref:hypothetical protein n=1 Tax=Paracoccus mutanolyticus TaxID=1499308 RepID=UPI0011AE31BB|nr:hypothetical protein [Paracoccus mutanolyticus]
MDTFSALMHGFSVATTIGNLGWCFLGVVETSEACRLFHTRRRRNISPMPCAAIRSSPIWSILRVSMNWTTSSADREELA